MVGHGSPREAPGLFGHGSRLFAVAIRGWRIALVVCALIACATAAAAEELDLRLRIEWGEGSQRHWTGVFHVSDGGKFSEIKRLGYDANAPTSITREASTLRFTQPAPVAFDGIDVRVQAAADATLTIQLQPDGQRKLESLFDIPLADFADRQGHQFVKQLDNQGNRLSVRRAPGDHLRLETIRDTFVFAPGEKWQFSLQPHRLGLPADTKLTCSLRLLSTWGRKEHSSQDYDLTTDLNGSTQVIGPLQLQLPLDEGAYDLVATLRERGFKGDTVAQRKVQLVIIDEQVVWPAAVDWKPLTAIRPDDPKWWESWKYLQQWTRSKKQPESLSDGSVTARVHLGQSVTELGADSWQAAPLPVGRVGDPHILEIEYPNDNAQTLGISIVEKNAAGRVVPLQIDSGVDVVELPTTTAGSMEKHRLIFWPRTKTPWLVVSNRRAKRPALFGKFQVLAGPSHLKHASVSSGHADGRTLAVYYDKPLFPENFSAAEALDPVPNRTLDDWNTFYDGGVRLVDYLKHVGYNAAIISVARDGGTIYPSEVLESTPRYDSGVFFLSGQDPQQKDVLEMLFRLFDREQLRLIPAIHLAERLPELEGLLKRGGDLAAGIELVGADGKPWTKRYPPLRGQAPYYNPLDPRVQSAIREVVNELVDRYSHHPSFAGVSLQLGPGTYVQLPGTVCANDDKTVARFKADTKADVPLEGPTRFADRAGFFTEAGRKVWLSWRAKQLAEFYRDLQQDISADHEDAQLYLAAAELTASPPVQRALHPRLPIKIDLAGALLQHGLDTHLLDNTKNIVLMRPERLEPTTLLADSGATLQLRDSDAVDELFGQQQTPGAINYHYPVIYSLPSFERTSPFGPENTHAWFVAHISPNGLHNRARFIRRIAALDTQMITEGGWMVPLGQEDSFRAQFEAFRMLPAAPFDTAEGRDDSPVVVRTLDRGNRTYCYIVNNSPWAATASVQFELPPRAMLHRFGADQPERLRFADGGREWVVQLKPYDLIAGYVDTSGAKVIDRQVQFAREIKPELKGIVRDITSRVDKLNKRTPLQVVPNVGFEDVARDRSVAGWDVARGPGIAINLDALNPKVGMDSLHMRVNQRGQVAWVRSKPFKAPKTGRISVLAWIRTKDAGQQPALRLAVDDGRKFYRFAPLGIDVNTRLEPTGNPARRIQEKWSKPYLFHLDDLPAAGLDDLMVGFDLMGPGEVWIDEVEVFDLYFFDNEVNALLKNVANAGLHLDEGRVAECERFLSSYWARFLVEHVPQVRVAELRVRQANQPMDPARAANPPQQERRRGWQRYVPDFSKIRVPFGDRE